MKEILRELKLGNSVAEEDKDLENYFVETDTFRSLIDDENDIIAGDKGTGKTALYKILMNRAKSTKSLKKVEILTAFNPTGSNVFQQLARDEVLTEGQYSTVWKAYILSLVGNWLLETLGDLQEPKMVKLDTLLKQLKLRVADDSPKNVFRNLLETIKHFVRPKKAAIDFKFNESGMPTAISPNIEFGNTSETKPEKDEIEIVSHTDSLGLLNDALEEMDVTVWIVLDRLDEAFQGYPKTEIPALRALLRTYLDLKEFDRLKLKLFVRRDLFRKITQGEQGFVNLTHINARKKEIFWENDDLLNLLIQRVKANDGFVKTLKLQDKTAKEIFYILFPDQVDLGQRRAKTWNWMLSRIRDGNDVKPPRNLIDLVIKAQEQQNRHEERVSREFGAETSLITSEAVKTALSRLSDERVKDTLLAEAGKYSTHIEKFRGGKAEYNMESLVETLNMPNDDVRGVIKVLVEMGFLEQTSETYKIPMLYRDGLEITQGKAFQSEEVNDED
ncbi:MAG TPA: hypothetical protein VF602_08245 [Pedobacter sp.]